jgi:hypothetical protein
MRNALRRQRLRSLKARSLLKYSKEMLLKGSNQAIEREVDLEIYPP